MVKYHLKYKHLKKETLQAVQAHWKMGFWSRDEQHKKDVFESLLSALCKIYQIKKCPHLVIIKDFNSAGICVPPLNLIILNKYSVVSLLHEFKHYKDMCEGKIPREENARGWSLSIINQINPSYLKELADNGKVKFISSNDIKTDVKKSHSECPFCLATIRLNSNYCYQCGAKL